MKYVEQYCEYVYYFDDVYNAVLHLQYFSDVCNAVVQVFQIPSKGLLQFIIVNCIMHNISFIMSSLDMSYCPLNLLINSWE